MVEDRTFPAGGIPPDPSHELAQLKERYARLSQLYHVSNVIHSTLDPQEALQLILNEALQLTHATSGSVVLINPTTELLEILASRGLPESARQLKLRVGEGLTGWVARHGKPVRVGRVQADPRYLMLLPEIQSELAVPLEVQGALRGVLNVDSSHPDAFGESDQELLEELAVQASKVIHNTWLYEQLRLKAQLLESLVRIGETVNSSLNLDETLRGITREACQLMGAKMSSLMLLDATRQWLELRASHGAGPSYIDKPRLGLDEGLLGVVIRRNKPVQVANVQISSRYQHVEVARREGLVSLLSVPLNFSGQPLGALNVYTAEPHSFSNEEIHILSMLAELSAIAIEKARLYERVVDVEEHLRQNEQLSAIGLLAAEVAHEIRNPLTVMKMLFHSLDLKFPPGDPRAQDAEIMARKMDLLNRIVEQVLDLARHSEPKLSPVDLNALLEDLALLTRHKLRQQHVELERCLAPDLPLVTADPTQLEQAFLNLTLNAVQAMPQGGRLVIRTRAVAGVGKDVNNKSVEIQFQDTGAGMSPEQRERAFSGLLSTTKDRGAGLGLRIVTRVVETHRGALALESHPGQGTTVTVTLPV
jgi:signal transduction histidine kinase